MTSSASTPWLRTVLVLTALTGWAVVIAAYLLKGELPDAALVGLPVGLLVAAYPQALPWSRRGRDEEEPE